MAKPKWIPGGEGEGLPYKSDWAGARRVKNAVLVPLRVFIFITSFRSALRVEKKEEIYDRYFLKPSIEEKVQQNQPNNLCKLRI